MIEPAPEGFNISRESWARAPAVVRSEIIRAHRELSECIPINKDRAARRRSRSMGGFYELHVLERDIQFLTPTQLARVAELRGALAPEIAHHAMVAERDADLAPFYDMAKAAGKTLPSVLREYIGIENLIRNNPTAGIKALAKRYGISLTDWATVTAAGYRCAHAALLPVAARAIREGRLPVLPRDAEPEPLSNEQISAWIESLSPEQVAELKGEEVA
jgi:hypothetical protein